MSSPDRSGPVLRLPLPSSFTSVLLVWFARAKAGPPRLDALADDGRAWMLRNAGYELNARILDENPHVRLQHVTRAQYGDPFPGVTACLTPPEWRAIDKSCTDVIIVSVKARDPALARWSALGLARGVATSVGGRIMDTAFPVIHAQASHEERLPEDGRLYAVRTVRVLSSIDARGRGWMTCTGLHDFGLPEIEIKHAKPCCIPMLAGLVNGLAQHLLDVACDPGARMGGALLVDAEPRVTIAQCIEASGQAIGPVPDIAPLHVRWRLRKRKGLDEFLSLMPPASVTSEPNEWLHGIAERIGAATHRPDAVRN